MASKNTRLRSVVGGGGIALATTVDYDGVLGSHVFQDDVRVIGVAVAAKCLVNDAHMNADFMIHGHVELSRQAIRGGPGVMARVSIHAGWTAIIALGGEVSKDLVYMFPDGTGWDFDEGEGVNMLSMAEYVGAGGPVSWWGEFVLFYIER